MKIDLLKLVAASLVMSLLVTGGTVSAQHRNDAKHQPRFDGVQFPYRLGHGLPAQLRITCAEGQAIVDVRGYSNVRMMECGGDTYTYLGRRYGGSFKVAVNAITGRIASVDRIKVRHDRKS
jgi:hypothetical protein